MQLYEREEEKENQQKLPFKSNLILRIIAAAYLLYLDYGIRDSIFQGTGTRQIVFALFGLLFLAAAVFLLVSSLRRLALGQYQEAAKAMEEYDLQQESGQEELRKQDQKENDEE